MQVTETLSEGLKRELKIVIGADELNARLDAKIDSIKDKVKLSGFRPGKVPISHLKKVYGRSMMAEVVQEAVSETTSKAITERDERPAFQPEIRLPEDEGTVDQVVEGNHDLEFIMSFEVLPKIELAELKGLKVERPVAEVDDEEVTKSLDRLREGNVTYEVKDGAAEDGDRVTIDFVGKIDGEPFEGGAGEGRAGGSRPRRLHPGLRGRPYGRQGRRRAYGEGDVPRPVSGGASRREGRRVRRQGEGSRRAAHA